MSRMMQKNDRRRWTATVEGLESRQLLSRPWHAPGSRGADACPAGISHHSGSRNQAVLGDAPASRPIENAA